MSHPPFYNVSVVDFEQVNACWLGLYVKFGKLHKTLTVQKKTILLKAQLVYEFSYDWPCHVLLFRGPSKNICLSDWMKLHIQII